MTTITNEVLDELLSGVTNADDLLGEQGLMKELKVRLMERMLGAELTEHLGYEPEAQPSDYQSNRRNGTTRKTLKGNDGALPIDVPRDRDGSFEPELIKKGQTRIDGMDDKIIGLYAAGLSTRDIRAHLEEVYGLKVSADLISRVTDAVLEEVSDWQNRALEPMYPIVFLDALRVKIRDAESRQVKNKAVYVALGVTPEGEREVLGLWIANNEGAKFWLSVMNNLRNRGLEDILIAVVDGLKGFPEAINAAYPDTTVQTCIVHLVRQSLNFCVWKDRKVVAFGLRKVFNHVHRIREGVGLNMRIVDADLNPSLLQSLCQWFCRRFARVTDLGFVGPAEEKHLGGLGGKPSLPQDVDEYLSYVVGHGTVDCTGCGDEAGRNTNVAGSLNHVIRVNGDAVAANTDTWGVAMEVPLRCSSRKHVFDVHVHGGENTSEFVDQGDVDVALNIFNDLRSLCHLDFADIANIFTGELAVKLDQSLTHIGVCTAYYAGHGTDAMGSIAGVEAFGAVGNFHVVANRHAQVLNKRHPCLSRHAWIDGGLQHHDGVGAFWNRFEDGATGCLNIGQIGFEVVRDGCRNGHEHDVTMRDGFCC